MKCPKCNYTSFDYNSVCPKCGNDNAEEQSRLNFSKNKPNPPFFLASLIGMADSDNPGILNSGAGMGTLDAEGAYGEMDGQDLLIALDDLDLDSAKPDRPEPPVPSSDEDVFEIDDSGENGVAPLEPEDHEILFNLEPAFDETEIDGAHKESDSQIIPDLEEMREEEQAAFQIDTSHEGDDVPLFLADETTDSEIPAAIPEDTKPGGTSKGPDSPELLLSLDDLTVGPSNAESSSGVMDDEIVFELEDVSEEDEAPVEKETVQETGFWDSDELHKQMAISDLDEIEGKKPDAFPTETTDEKKEVDLFSDLDIEPLELELSLEDVEKSPD